jgi:hypothetical protein
MEVQIIADKRIRDKALGVRLTENERTPNSFGNEFTDDRLKQSDSVGQGNESNSEGPIHTGWESKRQDYFNEQVHKEQDEGLNNKDSNDYVGNSSDMQSSFNNVIIPPGELIEDESDYPKLRERQRRAKLVSLKQSR